MIKKSTTMVKLSSGVELSEATIISALCKAGISVEPPKPKHIFEAGDTAVSNGNEKRLIVYANSGLSSYDPQGRHCSHGQQQFELNGYKFTGKCIDFRSE